MKRHIKKIKLMSKRTEKQILKRLDRIHKKNEALFKEDKILLRWLKKEIDAQQRRAS